MWKTAYFLIEMWMGLDSDSGHSYGTHIVPFCLVLPIPHHEIFFTDLEMFPARLSKGQAADLILKEFTSYKQTS